MNPDQLEFLISQYLDGTLDAPQRAALELELKENPTARALLEQYTRIDSALKNSMPEPHVRWDAFARHLSQTVTEQEAEEAAPVVYSIAMWRNVRRLAVAACVMAAVGLSAWFYLNQPTQIAPTSVALVTGPTQEAAAGDAVCDIAVTGPAAAQGNAAWTAGTGVVLEPSRLVIASVAPAVQDTHDLPY